MNVAIAIAAAKVRMGCAVIPLAGGVLSAG
jgi:hypothetical protein